MGPRSPKIKCLDPASSWANGGVSELSDSARPGQRRTATSEPSSRSGGPEGPQSESSLAEMRGEIPLSFARALLTQYAYRKSFGLLAEQPELPQVEALESAEG